MSLTRRALTRRSGIDPGCGCGPAMRTEEAARKALSRKPEAEQEQFRVQPCPDKDRPGVFHLVPAFPSPSLVRSVPLGRGEVKIATRRRVGTASGMPADRNSGPTPKVRRLVLERDGYACVCCGQSIIGQRYSLAHRLRASHGGRPVASNLIVLLGWGGESHHGRVDLYEDPADEAKGYRLKSGKDPKAEGVMLFSEGGSGITVWLDDLGNYLTEPPDEVAA